MARDLHIRVLHVHLPVGVPQDFPRADPVDLVADHREQLVAASGGQLEGSGMGCINTRKDGGLDFLHVRLHLDGQGQAGDPEDPGHHIADRIRVFPVQVDVHPVVFLPVGQGREC